MKKILCLAAALLAGCTTGPGSKPGTLRWKVFTDTTQLDFPPTAWTSGSLRHEMTSARYEKRYTVLKPQSYSLRFEFRVTNTGSQTVDLNQAARPSASLTLKDGGQAPSMIWIYSAPRDGGKLEPGQSGSGLLFNDNSVPEGARPALLSIDGRQVRF